MIARPRRVSDLLEVAEDACADGFLGPALHWRYHLFGSGGYILAEFRLSYSLFINSHCVQHDVRFNKGLISIVRLSCRLFPPAHVCLFRVWGKQGLIGLS